MAEADPLKEADPIKQIPRHLQMALQQLIAKNLPAEQIAFMMRLSPQMVAAEIGRVNDKAAAAPKQ